MDFSADLSFQEMSVMSSDFENANPGEDSNFFPKYRIKANPPKPVVRGERSTFTFVGAHAAGERARQVASRADFADWTSLLVVISKRELPKFTNKEIRSRFG